MDRNTHLYCSVTENTLVYTHTLPQLHPALRHCNAKPPTNSTNIVFSEADSLQTNGSSSWFLLDSISLGVNSAKCLVMCLKCCSHGFAWSRSHLSRSLEISKVVFAGFQWNCVHRVSICPLAACLVPFLWRFTVLISRDLSLSLVMSSPTTCASSF